MIETPVFLDQRTTEFVQKWFTKYLQKSEVVVKEDDLIVRVDISFGKDFRIYGVSPSKEKLLDAVKKVMNEYSTN